MTRSEIIQIILSSVGLLIALSVGVCQIYLANQMKDFEVRQDSRDKERQDAIVFAKVTRFIQKYSKSGHDSEIYLLPLCVVAYAYNPVYPYRRKIYREFCGLTEDVQNEILRRFGLSIVCKQRPNFYNDMLERILSIISDNYPNDQNIFYDNGKYFECALLSYGECCLPELTCKVDSDEFELLKMFSESDDDFDYLHELDMSYSTHIQNFLLWHKTETPIYMLAHEPINGGISAIDSEMIMSYLCCMVAEYATVYNFDIPDGFDSGVVSDFTGQQYMEDLFLQVLYDLMVYTKAKLKDDWLC